MTFERIIRSILTVLPYGSLLEQLIFGTKDDKKVSKIVNSIEKGDKALGLIRDE
ncbi:MAG: hypothetical protein J5545_09120 [Bacteroidaceae bacterium]|nr:hypothetical protein [Bacteroidaceae bacterium]